MTIAALERPDAKAMGAYYTDDRVAEFLVRWAVRSRDDIVLDPSFGGGVFLAAAAAWVEQLGGQSQHQVMGIELSADTFTSTAAALSAEHQVARLFEGDFFSFASPDPAAMFGACIPLCDAVVGNPPFIRYQRFTGIARSSGLRRAAEEGVVLPKLASSWAPFLVHSASFLKRGGRLAMVVPYEIVYARYAKPVLEYVVNSFRRVTLLTFRNPLFPHLNESTVLLLADGRGDGRGELFVRELLDARALSAYDEEREARPIDVEALLADEQRFAAMHLPNEARELYRHVRPLCARLGAFADVGIGYVTGANDFFHLSPEVATLHGLPQELLAPTVCRGAALLGARFRNDDWHAGLERGDTAYLLRLDEKTAPRAADYLARGEASGVPRRYKCRSRKPWYRVPNVYRPDAFLTYMSGRQPHLVINEAEAFAPNTLHVVRLHQTATVPVQALAVLWQTSMAMLSAEIEGHPMGGGMLKLEPREAERVFLPWVERSDFVEVAAEIDTLLREGRNDAAREVADQVTSIALGVSATDCARLYAAAVLLRNRRMRSDAVRRRARDARRTD